MAVMDNSPNPLRITRSELYERAWATPIIRLKALVEASKSAVGPAAELPAR